MLTRRRFLQTTGAGLLAWPSFLDARITKLASGTTPRQVQLGVKLYFRAESGRHLS